MKNDVNQLIESKALDAAAKTIREAGEEIESSKDASLAFAQEAWRRATACAENELARKDKIIKLLITMLSGVIIIFIAAAFAFLAFGNEQSKEVEQVVDFNQNEIELSVEHRSALNVD